MNTLGGINKTSRALLGKLLQESKDGFSVKEAAKILLVDRARATSLLAMWTRRGWLHRVRRGFYIPVPFQSTSPEVTPEEPWLIAHKLFSPSYIGGWTAAHYFGFTEQLFNSIFVMTTKKVHQREQHLNGVTFKVKTVLQKKMFGTQFIWSGNIKVAISDPTKTIIDGLNDPSVFGGIRMVIDILSAYIQSEEFNQKKILDYAKKMDNSAIYKRLGFLVDLFPAENSLIIKKICARNLKSGYSQLDPATPGNRLVTEWHLWVPKSFNLKEVQ